MAQTYQDLAAVVEQPDDQFKTTLPTVIDDVEENLATVLVEQPEAYEQLSTRMSTLEGIDEYATEHTETAETFLDVLWNGMELITRTSSEVQEHVDTEFTVNWVPEDAPVEWHLQTDPDPGIVTGGTSLLDDPELEFSGPADVMFSMLGDDEFNGAMAFIQNKFEITGPMGKARSLDATMDTVVEHAQELDPGDIE